MSLGLARTSSLDNVVVADFDGDEIAEVGHFSFGAVNGVALILLRTSKSGAAPLAYHSVFPVVEAIALNGIGNFDGLPGAAHRLVNPADVADFPQGNLARVGDVLARHPMKLKRRADLQPRI